MYTNYDTYTVEPVPGTPATVSASVNLDTVNPIPYSDSLLLSYEISLTNGELYYVQSLIEQYQVYEYLPDYLPDTVEGPYVLADSFYLNVTVPPDSGLYSLFLTFYYSSNTHSLGDILGVEAENLSFEFIIDFKGGDP